MEPKETPRKGEPEQIVWINLSDFYESVAARPTEATETVENDPWILYWNMLHLLDITLSCTINL